MKDNKVIKIGTLAVIALALAIGGLSCVGEHSGPPPGSGHLPSLSIPKQVNIGRGATKSIEMTLTIKWLGGESGNVTYRVLRAERNEEYSPQWGGLPYKEELPMPEGLDVSIEPDQFIIDRIGPYESRITVKTSPELPKGEYELFLEILFENDLWPGSPWITVNVVS
jgi:hypothetical protein